MGDHFVLLVDRLVTASNLEAGIGSSNQSLVNSTAVPVVQHEPDCCPNLDEGAVPGSKLVECRICQDEDLDSNMESPCSCCGSLKYAHRSCVQRWCNEKGDTVCEICLQQFNPGYTAPSQLFHYGRIPMSLRGNWEIFRHDLRDLHFLPMVGAGRDYLYAGYDDSASSSVRSIFYCRIILLIFMVLLFMSHTLPIIITLGDQEHSLAEFLLVVLRTVAVLLPVYVMAQALAAFHRRRRHRRQWEGIEFPTSSSEG